MNLRFDFRPLHLVSVFFVNFLLVIRIGTVPYSSAGDQMHWKEDRCRTKTWTLVSDLRYSEWRSLRSLRTRWFWWGEVCFVGSKKRSSWPNLSVHFIYETCFWMLGIKVPSENWRPVFSLSSESSDQVTSFLMSCPGLDGEFRLPVDAEGVGRWRSPLQLWFQLKPWSPYQLVWGQCAPAGFVLVLLQSLLGQWSCCLLHVFEAWR